MRMAADAGIACTVHAIGDAAVRRALDLMDATARGRRFLIASSTSSVSTRVDLGPGRRGGHRARCSPRISSPTSRWWSGTGARAAQGAYAFRDAPARRGRRWCSAATCRWPRIDPRDGVFAALERRADDGGPAGGWRPGRNCGSRRRSAATPRARRRGRSGAPARHAWRPGSTPILWRGTSIPPSMRMTAMPFRAGRAALTVVARRGRDAIVMRHRPPCIKLPPMPRTLRSPHQDRRHPRPRVGAARADGRAARRRRQRRPHQRVARHAGDPRRAGSSSSAQVSGRPAAIRSAMLLDLQGPQDPDGYAAGAAPARPPARPWSSPPRTRRPPARSPRPTTRSPPTSVSGPGSCSTTGCSRSR